MNSDRISHMWLAGSLLLSLQDAIRERSESTAEHLLRALEELARAWPECGSLLDQAYLSISDAGGAR